MYITIYIHVHVYSFKTLEINTEDCQVSEVNRLDTVHYFLGYFPYAICKPWLQVSA